MSDLNVSLGGDISEFERSMTAAQRVAQQRSTDISSSFADAAKNIDTSFGNVLDKHTSGLGKLGDAAKTWSGQMNSAIGDVQKRWQDLQGKIDQTKTSLLAKFQGGQATDPQTLLNQVIQAGGLRAFAGAAGGPIGVAATVGGTAYQQIQQFAQLGDAAQKAKITSQELSGLQKVMTGLGVDAKSTTALMTAFANSVQGSGSRDKVAGLVEVAAAIKAAGSEDEKLSIATKAVGSELASSFVAAVEKSATGLRNLKGEIAAAAPAFTNDLSSAAQSAREAIDGIGKSADSTYSKLKALLGVASSFDKLKAAQFDVSAARANVSNAGVPAPLVTDEYGGATFGAIPGQSQAQAERGLLAAQMRLVKLQQDAGIKQPGIDVSGFGYASGKTTVIGPMQGPDAPADKLGLDGGGGRGGAGSKARTDAVERFIDSEKKSVAVLQAEAAAEGLNTKAKAEAIEMAKAEAAARERGTDLTSKERLAVIANADAMVDAKKKIADAQQATANVNSVANFGGEQILSVLDQIGKKGVTAKGVIEDLAKSFLKAAENAVLMGNGPLAGLFGTQGKDGVGGGLMGLIAGLFTPASSHAEGGVAGYGPKMMVPTSFFANAKHFASGGGIPAILHPGEIVLNAAQQGNVAKQMGGATQNVHYNPIINGSGLDAKQLSAVLDQHGRQLVQKIGRNIGPMMGNWEARYRGMGG